MKKPKPPASKTGGAPDRYARYAMTPKAYATALSRLERGSLSGRSVSALGRAVVERLSRAGLPDWWAEQFSMVIQAYWHHEIDSREEEREALAIAKAASALRDVLMKSERVRPYLQLPDAMLWAMAGAQKFDHQCSSIGLARYLEVLQNYLCDSAYGSEWEQHGNPTGRKATLVQFVIRFVDGKYPQSTKEDGTPGQRRYGRNAGIAEVCTALLATKITRQQVAQSRKNMV